LRASELQVRPLRQFAILTCTDSYLYFPPEYEVVGFTYDVRTGRLALVA
jgi:hypothetical protein